MEQSSIQTKVIVFSSFAGKQKKLVIHVQTFSTCLQIDVLKQKQLREQRNIGSVGSRVADISVVATEYSPVLKWLSYRASPDAFAEMDEATDEAESEISEDDEIQEW